MRDLHRTTSLREAPHTQYEIGILEPSDIAEFAPLLLDLYGQRNDEARAAQEAKRLKEIMRIHKTKIAVAMPVGELALAADARITPVGDISIVSIGPIRGPKSMPDVLEEYLRAFVDPVQYPLPGQSHDWQRALLSLGPIDSRLAIDPRT